MESEGNKMKFETRKCVEVSTAHITRSDDEILTWFAEMKDKAPISVAAYEYGYYIALMDRESFKRSVMQKLAESKLSTSFIKLCGEALLDGAQILNIDRDGPEYDDLPKVWVD
jgi:hypothetical protein